MLMSGTEEDPGIIQQVTATVIQYLKKKKPTEVPWKIIMTPFEELGVYCFAHVGWSVCLSVRLSVDQMVSAHYLNYLSQSVHILHAD